MTSLLRQQSDSYEYRAVFSDAEDLEPDFEGPFATQEEAADVLKVMLRRADPPYDDGWVERRPCVIWERIEP